MKHDYCNAFPGFAVITILGMPIALALVGGGMAAIVAGDLMPLFTSVQKMFSSVDSFTLAAIPFFMLAGALMSSGGISRRLIDLPMLQLVGCPAASAS